MKEDQDLPTRAYKAPTRDKLNAMHRHASTCSCWCEQHKRENGTNRNMSTSSCPSSERTVERGYAGVKTREQKKAKDAKRTRGIVHENGKNKRTSQVQDEMRKLMHHVEQELFSLSEGVFGMTTEAVGWTPSCAPRQDVSRWSTFVVTRCTRVRPERRACVRRRKHPSRQDGRRQANVKEKPWHWLTYEGRTSFYAPARRKVFVKLPPEDHQAGDEHMCGLLPHSFYGACDAA